MVVERGLQAALFFIVAKLLGPTEFGIAAISISLPMVFVATMAGVLQIVIQRRTLTDGFLLSTFWLALAIGGVFTLVSLLLAPLVAHFVGVPGLVHICRSPPLLHSSPHWVWWVKVCLPTG